MSPLANLRPKTCRSTVLRSEIRPHFQAKAKSIGNGGEAARIIVMNLVMALARPSGHARVLAVALFGGSWSAILLPLRLSPLV